MLNLTPESLKSQGLILFEALGGSRAYGLDTPQSDWDTRGVFMAPLEQLFGVGGYQPQVQDETHNIVYYELGRLLELLGKNNPSALELLASPADCVSTRHRLMDRLKPELFLSKLCCETFGQYALAQVKKARSLNKKISQPLPVERRSVLDCCYVTCQGQTRPLKAWLAKQGFDQRDCGLIRLDHMPGLHALYYDGTGQLGYSGVVRDEASACDISLSSIPKGQVLQTYLYFNADLFKKICRDYKDYWAWVEQRNQTRFQAAVDSGSYDTKNMMHTFRLLAMAEEIASTGELKVRRADREHLLAIRRGAAEYDHLVAAAEAKIARIRTLFAASNLPETPDNSAIQRLLIDLRKAWFEQK